MSPDNTGAKQARGRFRKGESGNPAGKPKGARNLTTRAVELLMQGDAEAITRKAIEAALAGDMVAIRMVLDRIAPASRDRVVQIELPELANVGDLPRFMSGLMRAVACGDIAPNEADGIAKLAEQYRRSIETVDIYNRLKALEKARGQAR